MTTMTPYLAVILVVAIILLILRINWWLKRSLRRKQEALFREKTSPFAEARSYCMVRECFFEQPGVAQVLDGKLSIYTVMGDTIEIPMAQVKLVKMDPCMLGRSPWWGLTGFWLETPKTSGLVLGFKDPQPWMQVLRTS